MGPWLSKRYAQVRLGFSRQLQTVTERDLQVGVDISTRGFRIIHEVGLQLFRGGDFT
jgi:hypothetical protein